MTWLWLAVLAAAAFAAQWGASQLAEPLKAVRARFGIAGAAGGALVALASASSDVAVNAASAVTGAGGIGLGNLLGSNVVSIPLVVAAAYLASRKRDLGEDHSEHQKDLQQGLLRVDADSVKLVALPYLVVIALFALLTVPPGWRGLQPVDGLVMTVAYIGFLGQAVARGRQPRQSFSWSAKKTWLALGGLIVLTVASYVIVTASGQIGRALGLPQLVTGLFVTATLTALPAAFTTWAVVRSVQVTSGVTNPFADNTVAMTLGALPLALVSLSIDDVPVSVAVLLFVALMPALYAWLLHRRVHGLHGQDVALLGTAFGGYVAAVSAVLCLS